MSAEAQPLRDWVEPSRLTQFAELTAKLDRPKMVDVVRKTLKKMSAQGQAMALALDLPDDDRALIEEATRG